jgi:hypothetical protein
MIKNLIMIFLMIIAISMFNTIHTILVTAIAVGVFMKEDELRFIDGLIIGCGASFISVIFKSLHFPSIQLFGDLFGGLNAWIMILISILFTGITIAIMIKASHEMVNWNRKN